MLKNKEVVVYLSIDLHKSGVRSGTQPSIVEVEHFGNKT